LWKCPFGAALIVSMGVGLTSAAFGSGSSRSAGAAPSSVSAADDPYAFGYKKSMPSHVVGHLARSSGTDSGTQTEEDDGYPLGYRKTLPPYYVKAPGVSPVIKTVGSPPPPAGVRKAKRRR